MTIVFIETFIPIIVNMEAKGHHTRNAERRRPNSPQVNARPIQASRPSSEKPWYPMAATYRWVSAQKDHATSRTQQWVFDVNSMDTTTRPSSIYKLNLKQWHDAPMACLKLEAEIWRLEEERSWRQLQRREREKTRRIQEETKRVEERIRVKTLRRKEEALKAREAAVAVANARKLRAWQAYEDGWRALSSSQEPLTFWDIPWPVFQRPKTADDITLASVQEFLLSQAHSEELKTRQRLRNAQMRWHPDRFARVLLRVVKAEDREVVETAAGTVSRCLNDLMKESK